MHHHVNLFEKEQHNHLHCEEEKKLTTRHEQALLG
jgi:hypothetical protein